MFPTLVKRLASRVPVYASRNMVTRAMGKPPPSWTWKTVVMGLMPISAFALGTWQVQRLQWKLDLIKKMEDRMEEESTLLPRRSPKDLEENWEFRRCLLRGVFDHSKEIFLGPRSRGDGNGGYFIITPMHLDDGRVVLVNRGWVSMALRAQKDRPRSLEEGKVVVEGLIRTSEHAGYFVPENVPEKNEWYRVDVDQMAALVGAEPVLVEAINDQSPAEQSILARNGQPIGRAPKVEMRNTHLQYAVTWYSLSFFTGIMMWSLIRKRGGKTVRMPRRITP